MLDASALLVLLKQEVGADRVEAAIADGAVMSAVNLAEVVSKLSEAGMPEAVIRDTLDPLSIEILDFDRNLAYEAGLLRLSTSHLGLSLGDRACLALAQHFGLATLTADRLWAELQLGVTVLVIR